MTDPVAKRARTEQAEQSDQPAQTERERLVVKWNHARTACAKAQRNMIKYERRYTMWYLEAWWAAAGPIVESAYALRDAYSKTTEGRDDLDKRKVDLLEQARNIDGFFEELREKLIRFINFPLASPLGFIYVPRKVGGSFIDVESSWKPKVV